MGDADAATLMAPHQPGPLHRRVRHGMRKPANWWQLSRFAIVGGSGYVVNLVVYAIAVHPLALHYRLAAVLAFLVAVTNNFVLNRHWTFSARDGHAGFQAARFFVVSVTVFAVQLGVLSLLVEVAGVAEVPAQAIAVLLCTPLNFVGNKLWSFGS